MLCLGGTNHDPMTGSVPVRPATTKHTYRDACYRAGTLRPAHMTTTFREERERESVCLSVHTHRIRSSCRPPAPSPRSQSRPVFPSSRPPPAYPCASAGAVPGAHVSFPGLPPISAHLPWPNKTNYDATRTFIILFWSERRIHHGIYSLHILVHCIDMETREQQGLIHICTLAILHSY